MKNTRNMAGLPVPALKRQQIKAHAITLRKQGWSFRDIAKECNIDKQTAYRWTFHITPNRMELKPQMFHHVKANMEHFLTFNGALEDLETNIRFPG